MSDLGWQGGDNDAIGKHSAKKGLHRERYGGQRVSDEGEDAHIVRDTGVEPVTTVWKTVILPIN